MNALPEIKFTDVIDVTTLKNIHDKLTKIVLFSTITVDIYGIPVCEENNFTPFCKLIRSSPEGLRNCISCDCQAGFLAMKDRETKVYTCHAGLMDCAAPIVVNNHHIGSVLGGQVLVHGEKTRDSIDIDSISIKYNIPLDKLKEVVASIPIVEREYLHNCVEFYTFLASNIAQMGIHKLTQEQLLKESQEKIELENLNKKAQLKTIKAQINPHFLFNTLNTIARLALIEDSPRTEELIYTLSDLLRYNLRNTEEFPKISTEIENIKRYLDIQTLRYSDRIIYDLDLEDSILDCRIPTMILQPLVENSLIHGLETKRDGGKVIIKGRINSEDDIVIEVNDNGKGIKSSTLHLINNMSSIENANLGIGIQNTHNRLRNYFGEGYGLKIESTLNIGTSVKIYIPKIK